VVDEGPRPLDGRDSLRSSFLRCLHRQSVALTCLRSLRSRRHRRGTADRPRPFGLHQGVDCEDSFRVHPFLEMARPAHRLCRPACHSRSPDASGLVSRSCAPSVLGLNRLTPLAARAGRGGARCWKVILASALARAQTALKARARASKSEESD